MAGGDSLVAHPRGCRPRSGRCRRKPGRRSVSVWRSAVPACAVDRLTGRARHTGGVVTRPLPGSIPDAPGSYQFIDRTAGCSTWARPSRSGSASTRTSRTRPGSAPRTAQMVEPGRPRRVDGGGQRVRGPAARAQPHPAVPTPLQRPAEGRQELPVAGPDRQRRVAPAGRGAGAQAHRGPVLRPLSQHRGHPGDPRPAPAVVPGADLLGHQAAAPPAAGPALPALPHRTVLRARAWGPSTMPSTTGWWPTSSPS